MSKFGERESCRVYLVSSVVICTMLTLSYGNIALYRPPHLPLHPHHNLAQKTNDRNIYFRKLPPSRPTSAIPLALYTRCLFPLASRCWFLRVLNQNNNNNAYAKELTRNRHNSTPPPPNHHPASHTECVVFRCVEPFGVIAWVFVCLTDPRMGRLSGEMWQKWLTNKWDCGVRAASVMIEWSSMDCETFVYLYQYRDWLNLVYINM